jgi:tetratricopeptide (TPR) repeat protein
LSSSAALPGPGESPIEAMRRLLEAAQASIVEDNPVQLTDHLAGSAAGGDLLRRCAIPHDFDLALLRHLGELGEAEAEERYVQFTTLSMMQLGPNTLSVHERWRQDLWRWWLAPAQRQRLASVSEKLVQWFTRAPDPSGEDPAARRRMFHLLGCRHEEGWAEFDRLFRAARHRRRFSECLLLLALMREYDPLLSPAERSLLAYHEGKIASDLRQWTRALVLLRVAADDAGAGSRLRANAEVRVAHVLRQLQRIDEAVVLLNRLLAATADIDPWRWRALYELGEIERDRGQLEKAERSLRDALASAGADEEADIAGVLNSLGTVQLKRRDADAAAESFQSSLDRLRESGDALRPATVLNNLALAHLERCDWAGAESALRESIVIKRQAGDLAGQATTLANLARAQAAQGNLLEAQSSIALAQTLFDQAGDSRGSAQARQAAALLAGRVAPPRARTGLPAWAWVLIGIGAVGVVLFVVSQL